MLIRRIRFPVAIRHRLFHKALHSSRPFRDHCADRPRSAPASAAFRHVDLQESDHKATAESGVLLGSRPSNRVSSTDCAKPGTASLFAANVASVHPELARLLAKRNDVLLRADFRPGAQSILDRAVARGELTRLSPRTYVRTTRLTEPWVRWAAALRYAGNCAALSFVTGLQFWRLMPPSPGAVHITIGGDRELRGGRGLVVHRRTGFRPEPPLALRRDGLVAAVLERCAGGELAGTAGDPAAGTRDLRHPVPPHHAGPAARRGGDPATAAGAASPAGPRRCARRRLCQ